MWIASEHFVPGRAAAEPVMRRASVPCVRAECRPKRRGRCSQMS